MLNENDIQDMATAEPVQEAPKLVGYLVILPGEPGSKLPEPMIGLYVEPSAAIIKKWKTIGFDYRPVEAASF
jgi:hypothetical protein